MNFTRLWNRLRGMSADSEREIENELAFHREMKERDFRDVGLERDEARYAAARSLGNLTLAREDARAAWTIRWMDDAARDLRYAARSLRSQPGFTIAATLALVLGIGVNAIVFNVYNALALAPWAIRDGARAVQVYTEHERGGWKGASWPQYRFLREHTQSLDGLAAFTQIQAQAKRGEARWDASVIAASDNYFQTIGTGFHAGRGLSAEANRREPEPEVVLEYGTWRSRFGADPSVIGEWIELNGYRLRVTGIAAEGFVGAAPVAPQMWVTSAWRDKLSPGNETLENHNTCCTTMIGRLKPGVTMAQTTAELSLIAREYAETFKRDADKVLVTKASLLANPSTSAKATPIFLAIGVAALLILLLACANVANLQIARAIGRHREISVRLSLGAGRTRILRQLFTESLLLTLIAGSISMLLNLWAPSWIVAMIIPDGQGTALRFETDYRVAAFILAVTFLAALVSGLAPAVRTVRSAVSAGMAEGGRTVQSGARLRSFLLAAQVALCAVLLSGATLLGRALENAKGMDPGFQYRNILIFAPNLSSSGVEEKQSKAILRSLIERTKPLPGVTSVAHASSIPLGRRSEGLGMTDPHSRERVVVGISRVSANYFETLGIPLRSGRVFTAAEETREDALIMNEAFATRFRPRASALDRQIVGSVANLSVRELGVRNEMFVYVPSDGSGTSQLVIRHAPGAGEALAAAMPSLAAEVDKRIAGTVIPYTKLVDDARYAAVVAAAVAGAMSSLALLLACVGIYGVASYNVSQRKREIGVRMALGASALSILRMVLRQNLTMVLWGAAAGLVGAFAFARMLSGMLFGVPPGDPLSLLLAMGVLLTTAIVSSLVPARMASAVDPAITLRHD